MRSTNLIVILSLFGCSEYGLNQSPEKIPAPTDSDTGLDFEEEEPDVIDDIIEIETNEDTGQAEVEEPEEEPEEIPCGESTDDCDADGYTPEDGDCDDFDASVHPYAGDTYGDGIDSDCDTLDCEAAGTDDAYYAYCPESFRNWTASFDYCTDNGYDALASIYDADIQTVVNTLILNTGTENISRPWVNLNPVGPLTWGSGEAITWSNWAPGEPSNGGSFCGHINRDYNGLGEWNDVPCSDNWALICETVIN